MKLGREDSEKLKALNGPNTCSIGSYEFTRDASQITYNEHQLKRISLEFTVTRTAGLQFSKRKGKYRCSIYNFPKSYTEM